MNYSGQQARLDQSNQKLNGNNNQSNILNSSVKQKEQNQQSQQVNQVNISKKNKKNKKRSSQQASNSDEYSRNANIDHILSAIENNKRCNDSDFYNQSNNKISQEYLSLVDSTEPNNNTVEYIRRKLSDQNYSLISPENKTSATNFHKKSNSNQERLSSSVSSYGTNKDSQYDDGFITIGKAAKPNNGYNNQLHYNEQNKQISSKQNCSYSINVLNDSNINQQNKHNNSNNQTQNKNHKMKQHSNQNQQQHVRKHDQIQIVHSNSYNIENSDSKHNQSNHNRFSSSGDIKNKQNQSSPLKEIKQHRSSLVVQQNQNNKFKNEINSLDYVQEEQRINNSSSQELDHENEEINQQEDKESYEYFSNIDHDESQQTSKEDNNHLKVMRKKTNRSKSIHNSTELGSVNNNSQEKLGCLTAKNDSKTTKDDTDFTSINNLENQNQLQLTNQSSQQSQNNSNVMSQSCQNLPNPPTLQKEKSITNEDKDKEKEEGSLAIFRCPIALEKYNIKLWIMYVDNLIEVMFKLPIELIILIAEYIIKGKQIQRKDFHIWVHFILILIPVLIFTDNLYIIEMKEYFDVSYWYHAFRGQSTLKLYGVLMTADIVDKMLCTFGEYLILDIIWQKLPKSPLLHLIKYIIPAILYVFLHSLVLFLSIIATNVILNSDISFLFVMMFVHLSMKLKSTIFKKFTKDGYVQQTHSDLRSRFAKFLYVFLIWASMRGFPEDIVRKLVYFLGFEVIVEWIKHIFLMLLNNLKLSIVESMSKSCKVFVAQVRIIPSFQAQEILNNKTLQTFMERENYLAQTPYVSPSLKIGFRVNFLAFHHAVIIIKILYPIMLNYFSYNNFWIAIFFVRIFQILNDLLIYKFSFNNNEIIKLYTLKNQSLLKTIFNKIDYLIFTHGIYSILKFYYNDSFKNPIELLSPLFSKQ
ncbi:eukaryotic membrane protein, cytomegalovirus gH-receptor family protein (macronuclear) [Tetrahymena thermophila SB210]|uniref:Eukaryotic membrane protein, cytomegalovirus gH-receptor family protein n=1 Tax=Tetrahymena thermophila (strain SB210) TaxID=312017 RepID=W7XGT0_TETTS|nr:eukaryotic membrane protein, cytomegalovirus gH-receptor family protein [Tetrahymena thermophila SB210]EWS76258.1 eukaryotic membrane protein, cytomegalovirus gH-receptor family protein [Tetrahymena thermophila SB210]|eukprot:XP_012651217.1 eukaryotic membrane protein, cytomegalovirus gH-receptor family protein [Tetrahymena thermophila SB210]